MLGEEGWVRTAEQGQLGRVRIGLGEDGAGRGRLGEDGCMRTGEDATAREDGCFDDRLHLCRLLQVLTMH